MADAPVLGLTLTLEREALQKDTAAEVHLVASVEARGAPLERERPALSVVFAVDTSGSMAGLPLQQVVRSIDKLVELLTGRDRVGIVAFSSEATVVADPQPLTDARRAALHKRVHRLAAEGNTNIEAGLRAAFEILEDKRDGERRLVLLLSDGAPNHGLTGRGELEALCASVRRELTVTAAGYDAGHDEELMAAIARGGGGQYFYVANPLECSFEFARALGAHADVVAADIELTLLPGRGVEIDAVLGGERPRYGAGGLVIPVPDVATHTPRHVVMRLRVTPPRDTGPWDALQAELSAVPAGGGARQVLRQPVMIPVKHAGGAPVKAAVVRVLLAHAEEVRAEARAAADRGSFDHAAALVGELLRRISSSGVHGAGDGSVLSEAYEQLVDEQTAYASHPSEEDYRAFKRTTMGMDMQQGGAHVTDRARAGAASAALVEGIMGSLPRARLVMTAGPQPGATFDLVGEHTIGRVTGNDICVPSGSISKRHTRIVGREGRFLVVDLRSTNGTLLNGARLDGPRELRPGDLVAVGAAVFRYEETTT